MEYFGVFVRVLIGGLLSLGMQVRLGWYLCSVAMEDEDVQRRGIVFVQFKVGPQLGSVKPQKKTLWKALMTTRSLPCRLGLHLVFDRTIMPLIWLIRFTASYSLRGLQVHEGKWNGSLLSRSSKHVAFVYQVQLTPFLGPQALSRRILIRCLRVG